MLVEKFLRTSDYKLSSQQVFDIIKHFVIECLKRNQLFSVDQNDWKMDYKMYVDFLELKVDPLTNSVLYELENNPTTEGFSKTFNIGSIWTNILFNDEHTDINEFNSSSSASSPIWPHARITTLHSINNKLDSYNKMEGRSDTPHLTGKDNDIFIKENNNCYLSNSSTYKLNYSFSNEFNKDYIENNNKSKVENYSFSNEFNKDYIVNNNKSKVENYSFSNEFNKDYIVNNNKSKVENYSFSNEFNKDYIVNNNKSKVENYSFSNEFNKDYIENNNKSKVDNSKKSYCNFISENDDLNN